MGALKNFIKKIIPTPFLKEVFLFYNKIKIQTADKLLFPEYKIPHNQFLMYRKGFPFQESGISIDDLTDDTVKSYMRSWYEWTQEEFILVFNKPSVIEPDFGWAIVNANRLIYYSLGVSRTWFQPKPSLYKFWRRRAEVKIEKAISLRDTGEENYFHFYNDVLTKLFFLQQNSVEVQTLPIIISKKLWDKEYFQFYLKNSAFLQSLKWIIQDRQYVRCESVIFCKPLTHRKDLWNLALTPVVSRERSMGIRKVFLIRNRSRLRFIENSEEIELIAKRNGFQVIDTDNFTSEEQRSIFFDTQFVVAIHGAGLTNMIFRTGTCRILELFPPPDLGYLPYHYIMLAEMFGFRYNGLVGENGRIPYSGGFYLSKENFEEALLSLVKV